jgi:hypothetical protein
VPGVVVLDEVIQTLKEEYGHGLHVTGLPAIKLSSPLLAEEQLTIRVDREDAETIAFTCRVGDRLVASGSIRAVFPDAR